MLIKVTVCRYTVEMLLEAIDQTHRGTYDFMYLPIDFKVISIKCSLLFPMLHSHNMPGKCELKIFRTIAMLDMPLST